MAARKPSGPWAIAPDEVAVERYLAKMPLPTRVVAIELDALARAAIPRMTIGIKWSVPFYAKKGPICYLSAAKEHVTFGLVQGAGIPDASGLLVGTGKSPIRKAIFPAGEPVPRAIVRAWLRHAAKLDKTWGAS
ncbi:MAG TPA: DUF1801 domain-containing protein [Candidatus Thermoplasmatota archaeon]|nr:DUF1801 domain-containing protein [Candidatus Thermoplasmatota archaeon]